MDSIDRLNKDITRCTKCARLTRYCSQVARAKKPQFQHEPYWGRPVPSFGKTTARLWILGLAPAAHGANRTGRMFTGDSSGDWLFRALHACGLAKLPTSLSGDDTQLLFDTYISAAVRCAPPDNKPTRQELSACAHYLAREKHLLTNAMVILALGKVAYDALVRLLRAENPTFRAPGFAHGACFEYGAVTVLASYHPSRQNTHTKRLTWQMWITIFRNITARLKDHAP